MLEWLTQEWFDGTRALADGQPERPGVSGRIQCTVTGGPRGDVSYYRVIVDGRLSESALGELADPQVLLTATWVDAARIQQGELDPGTAFMQGRVKVAGDMAAVMALLPVTRTPEYRSMQQEIAAVTVF